MKSPAKYCGKCHTCGTVLQIVLDGEEWCPVCGTYRRYRSHGWGGPDAEKSPCSQAPLAEGDTLRRSGMKKHNTCSLDLITLGNGN